MKSFYVVPLSFSKNTAWQQFCIQMGGPEEKLPLGFLILFNYTENKTKNTLLIQSYYMPGTVPSFPYSNNPHSNAMEVEAFLNAHLMGEN